MGNHEQNLSVDELEALNVTLRIFFRQTKVKEDICKLYDAVDVNPIC